MLLSFVRLRSFQNLSNLLSRSIKIQTTGQKGNFDPKPSFETTIGRPLNSGFLVLLAQTLFIGRQLVVLQPCLDQTRTQIEFIFSEKFNAACFIYELFVLWYHPRFQPMFRLHLEKSFEIVLYYLFY